MAMGPGRELHGLTNGHWGLYEAIRALVSKSGGVQDLVIATWTAGRAKLEQTARLRPTMGIDRIRLLVDRSFATRQPKYCSLMRYLFGDDCIRFANTHAKFALGRGRAFDWILLTSMNLNSAPRIENYSVYSDPAFIEQYSELVEAMYALPSNTDAAYSGPSRTDRIFKDLEKRS